MPTMLNALGLHDESGVIYEVVQHDYFNMTDVGHWDQMMPGMINLVGTFFIKVILIYWLSKCVYVIVEFIGFFFQSIVRISR